MSTDGDPFDLARFLRAQEASHADALAELRAGAKRSHWMWYIFPQAEGLGTSAMARAYAIRSRAEAEAYAAHPVLGAWLREAATALIAHRGRSAEAIMGAVDAMKLQSSMTLFAAVAEDATPFAAVLDAFYAGERDARTMAWLETA